MKLSIRYVESNPVTVQSGTTGSVQVDPPLGYTCISGGFDVSGGTDYLIRNFNMTSDVPPSSWIFQVQNIGTSQISIVVYAYCVSMDDIASS